MKAILRFKGGAGSGHYNHAGRPGKIGGSTPGKYSRQLAYAEGLSPEDRKVVRRYTGGDFTWMNRHMRTGHKTSQSVKDKIITLKRVVDEAPAFGKSTELVRMTSVDMSNYKIGDTFTERAFSSTSLDKNIVSLNSHWFRISMPAHAKGLFVSGIGGHASEREVILNPSSFKITGITPMADRDNRFVYDMEWIGDA